MRTTEEIKNIVKALLENSELFPVDVALSKENKIEVTVDSLSGVNISTCMELSRKLEEQLDREKEDFELTVSSAGIGTPFKVEGQYRKNIGNPVEVRLKDASTICGRLKAFDGSCITVEYEEKKTVEGKKKKETVVTEKTISLSDIKQIKDIVTF